MPTAYTARIKNDVSFKEFAMCCARGMGACVTLRDSSWDTPIPEEFSVDTYHSEKAIEAEEYLHVLRSLSASEAEAKAQESYERELSQREQRNCSVIELQKKYQNMFDRVRLWNPPTREHEAFKSFMLSQIALSIEGDCTNVLKYSDKRPVKKLTGEAWLASAIEETESKLLYHREKMAEEFRAVHERNQWLKELRDSLDNYEDDRIPCS